ncbi:tetratricopeptide repeat protein [bacterium]|nr:tetratricopeptide repeat protein [bacterium]
MLKFLNRPAYFLAAVLLALPASVSAEEPFDPVASLYEKGNEYFRKGSYTSAVSVFQLVSENHPEHILAPEALFSIASAKQKMNDAAGARAAYEELLRRYPAASAIPDALLQLGTVHASSGNSAEAERVWRRLSKDYPRSIAARISGQRLRSIQAAPDQSPSTPLAPPRPLAPPMSPEKGPAGLPAKPTFTVPSRPPEPAGSVPPAVYTVRKNDSLSKIAKKFLGSTDRYVEIAKLNNIRKPYTLEVGQELKIPGAPPSPAPAAPRGSSAPSPLGASPSVASHGAGTAASVPPPFEPKWEGVSPDDIDRSVDSIKKWVDNRSEGYEALQTRLLELQKDVHGQKVLEKQVEFLKAQLDSQKKQNDQLKQEVITHIQQMKDLQDRNVALKGEMSNMVDSVERAKALQVRSAELDGAMAERQKKVKVLEKQNETLSETLTKMRDAYDAQIGLVRAYYDSEIARLREEHDLKLDTTVAELAWLREETQKKEKSLMELKRDYADLMKKTAALQKDMIEDKKSRVSLAAAKESLQKAQDLRRSGNFKEAEAAYKEALSVYPDYADAMNGLAYLYTEQNRNLDDAEKLVDRAISIDPEGRGYYYDTLGWIHYTRLAHAAALEALQEAYRLIPADDLPSRSAVSFHLGKVYHAMSDKDKAFFYYIDAIKLGPRTRWASLAERELGSL